MTPKLIKTAEDYQEALKRLEALMEVLEPTEEQNDEMKLLGILIEAYEQEIFTIPLPEPITTIDVDESEPCIWINDNDRLKFNDPCRGCPNDPRNGGSGFCNCMIPYLNRPTNYSVIC